MHTHTAHTLNRKMKAKRKKIAIARYAQDIQQYSKQSKEKSHSENATKIDINIIYTFFFNKYT